MFEKTTILIEKIILSGVSSIVKNHKIKDNSMSMVKNASNHKPIIYRSVSFGTAVRLSCAASLCVGFLLFFFLNRIQAQSSQRDKNLSLFYACHLYIRLRSLQRQPGAPCIVALRT